MEWWAIIALAGIAMGAFSEWLKFKSKQEKLGASAHELEDEVRTLRAALDDVTAEREALTRRVQNLETIVTSEVWDDLALGANSDTRVELPGEVDESARDAERIARRLRG